MHGPCRPPTFDQRDWSAFDFSRWHLDGLPVDPTSTTSAAVADLAQRLFSSEEWRQHFQGSLPALQRGVLGFYREHARELEQEKTAVAKDFDERIAGARTRSEEFGKAMEAAGSPPVVEPDRQTFHLGVRVTGKDVHLGLPSAIVRVTAPRDPKTVLAQGMTDRDGNALLTVPAAKASEGDKGDATLEILTVAGKSLQRLPDAVCIRPNQADTKVVSLKDSADTAPLKSAALEMRSQRVARAREMVTSIDRLKQERQARLHDLDRRLEENRKIIAALEGAPAPAPSTGPEAPPDAEPARKRPSAPRSGRKRP
jgi:hypothetical protein